MSDIEVLVASFVAADADQKDALVRVSEAAQVKHAAVLGLRDAGLTYRQIADRVGMSVPGIQRIAYKPGRDEEGS